LDAEASVTAAPQLSPNHLIKGYELTDLPGWTGSIPEPPGDTHADSPTTEAYSVHEQDCLAEFHKGMHVDQPAFDIENPPPAYPGFLSPKEHKKRLEIISQTMEKGMSNRKTQRAKAEREAERESKKGGGCVIF